MATALDIITDAMVSIGVYAAGEPITDADAERALSKLNDMLDSWSLESLTCYAFQTQSFPLVGGQASYTIGGAGGNFVGSRPIRLNEAPGSAFLVDPNGETYPLAVVTQERWNQIGNQSVTSSVPDTLWYNPQFPYGIINIFPVPILPYTLTFICQLAFAAFSNLAAPMTLPPGYKAALQSNLAIELWPLFKPDGSAPGQVLLSLAMKYKGNVKRTNMRPLVASYDRELVSRGAGTYNIFRDR